MRARPAAAAPQRGTLRAVPRPPAWPDQPASPADYALRGAALLTIVLGSIWVLFDTMQ